jgi:RNA polymerase sigma factor (sigma-70 family)
MQDSSDMELLRAYGHGSESAFAEVVRRQVDLVYSVALRHVGHPAQAEEITQAVFIILARKASSLRADTILEGWLHRTTRLTALSCLRGERRRQFREQEAYMRSTLEESSAEVVWDHLAPLLDEGMSQLGSRDRDALMLRFFKEQSVREVAAAMSVTETAAQRRILRAVEKLRRFFSKRGVVVPAVFLTAAISANSVHAAPAVLTKSATTAALAKMTTAGSANLTLAQEVWKLLAWAKLKAAVTVGAFVLLAAGAASLVATKTVTPSPSHLPNESNAGYETPEATLQTAFKAMSRGDTAKWLASFSPSEQEAMQSRFGRTEARLKQATVAETRTYSNVRIAQKDVVSEDEVLVHLQFPAPEPEMVLIMKRTDNKWKVAGQKKPTR